ncbi:hypothetical protein AVEN_129624-1 [Araneus ventricosus]|uniref:Uncharacterized protein n=1 Tax=Araneus ventricosus TaxID=182803 RepID=A0A4Y2FIN0_ARAVE|nr:hypothetical protein AVEN_129624-1 [Araneus ventricosus]
MSANARTSKGSESTDEDLSTVLVICCRLRTLRADGATGRIPNVNRFPSTTSSNQVSNRGDKALVYVKSVGAERSAFDVVWKFGEGCRLR